MKQSFVLCIFSAVIGAILALAIYNSTVNPNPADAVAIGPNHALLNQEDDQFRDPTVLENRALVANRRFTAEELVNINVYDKVNSGVVNIDTRRLRERGDIFFSRIVPEEGSGSGWVLDHQGHIVTNHHVISDSDSIEVTLADGESYPASVVGADPANDIAVVKINAPGTSLFPVKIGESTSLKVGQKVFAIGNPFGLERTMTTGIISSLNRSLKSKSGRMMKSIIQLDAALNQGNSGGPLLDNAGELIGMNTAIASAVGENSGVGFAVPANTIRRVVPELIKFGKVVRPTLGVEYVPARRGVGVGFVVPDGPAERAGMRGLIEIEIRQFSNGMRTRREIINRDAVDIILAVGNTEVNSSDQLQEVIETYKPGDQVTLKLFRKGRAVEVPVVLGEEE